MNRDGLPAIAGTLLSPRAAAAWLGAHHTDASEAAGAGIAAWAARIASSLGPAAGRRRLLESIEHLFECLGFECRGAGDGAVAVVDGGAIMLLAFPWGRPFALDSRSALSAAAAAGADWAAGFNGLAVCIIDARAGSPRRTAAVTVDDLAADAATSQFIAAVLEAGAFRSDALASAVRASDRSSAELKHGLREGVQASLSALTSELPFDAGVSVIFRLLFVLFAEARALVPMWHHLYRDHYSIAHLTGSRRARDPRGTWAALEGARRLLGEGCRAGTLEVCGFNGRLFAPGPVRRWAASPLLDSRLDRPAAAALASLTEFHPARGGARRVNYAELDVEELGSIYERVLDLDPAAGGRARKESGSFYTPRPLTEFIVRRTLAPLVEGASSRQILSLRVLDPAMGSGAFLVAALRYLSGALETALVGEGGLPEQDVTGADRERLRRLVARQCLYGVDANPMAVMLAKLSLWLATLAPGRPLGFLDHHLRCGNSLAGADFASVRRAPGLAAAAAPLPLFDDADVDTLLSRRGAGAAALAGMPEDTLEQIRRKYRAHETDGGKRDGAWRAVCDLWCAWWFLPPAARPDAREYHALADALLHGSNTLPRRRLDRRVRDASAASAREHLFHWPLEFPDVFHGGGGGGFDAIVGNPPWEMLRAGGGSGSRDALKAFARGSGVYTRGAGGHINLYQLFMERMLQLVRAEGRIGVLVPWGLMTDDGSAKLRRVLLDGGRIETLVRLDNHDAIFQAHRSLRFAAITLKAGEPTGAVEISRAGRLAELDDLPGAGSLQRGAVLTREGHRDVSGPAGRIPDVAGARELSILLALARRHRALGDPRGWGASFGREVNLTDDRRAFARSGMPVLEGKHLHPHRVDASSVAHRIATAAAARLLPHRPFDRARLAYRDVTAPTNRQTLIAAIVPAGMVTSHSLFCLRNAWDLDRQRALCLILNSAVANFLVRLFVGSHVTTSLIEWLPVPDHDRALAALAGLPPGAQAESAVADLYGLAADAREAL